MPHRIDRHLVKPDASGGDTHTAAVFLLSFLLMGFVSTAILAGQEFQALDISKNPLITNFIRGTRSTPRLAEASGTTSTAASSTSSSESVAARAATVESVSPTPLARQTVRVANTGGAGAYIRRTTNLADRLVAWPDNTRMEIVGEDRQEGGETWRNVRDPAGNVGWIPADYLSE